VGYPVAGQFVGDQHPRHVLQPRQQRAGKPGRGLRVPPGGDQDVQHAPVLVHRPPQVMGLPTDLDEYLVEVPCVPGTSPAPAQPGGVGLPELRTSLPDRLVADDDPPFQHHLLHLAETEREPVIQPDTVGDDLHRVTKPLVGHRLDPHQPSPSHLAASNPRDPPSHGQATK
jgi:hypothetical protein